MSFNPTPFRQYCRSQWGPKTSFRPPQVQFNGAWSNLPMKSKDGQLGTFVVRSIGSPVNRFLTGVSRLGPGGTALGNCVCTLFQTGGDRPTQIQISDASGNYNFANPGSGPFYVRAYQVGSPDLAGTTRNNLIAT
jgi:hypothetical protein